MAEAGGGGADSGMNSCYVSSDGAAAVYVAYDDGASSGDSYSVGMV